MRFDLLLTPPRQAYALPFHPLPNHVAWCSVPLYHSGKSRLIAWGLIGARAVVLMRAMRKRAAGLGCAELSADDWEVVAEHLRGDDGNTWRGLLQAVCRAAREGVHRATAAVHDGEGSGKKTRWMRRVAARGWTCECSAPEWSYLSRQRGKAASWCMTNAW